MLILKNKEKRFFLVILFLVFAVLLRFPTFGLPDLQMDEDWYLYVGGQMLHGFMPYIDIWDRKPFGLFVLYAFFHLFGEYCFYAYQIGALFSVCATAFLVMKIGEKVNSQIAGLTGGLLYIAGLNCFAGWGGAESRFL